MASETIIKGEIACLKVELRAYEKGAIVSKPSIECRYDRVIDIDGRLYRTQIKYANGKSSHAEGAVTARLLGTTRNGKKLYYSDLEIDALLVYIPKIDKICWFDKKIFTGKGILNIRIQPTKNCQVKGCLMANEYFW